VRRYASVYKSGAEMPPIRAALVDGVLFVVDGWHRVAALERVGAATATVEIIQCGARDALWLAARANLQHGLPLKAKEVRQAFRAYVKARQHRTRRGVKSYREIAHDLGGIKSYSTIRNWMIRDFPHIAREMGGDEGAGAGGLDEWDLEEGYKTTVRTKLAEAQAAMRGVKDPEARGELIALAEEALEAMKAAEKWRIPPDPFGF
jgi:hypothetical protein